LFCTDRDPAFPGTDNPDFYNSCVVCKGYKQGTYQCRGNPQVLTRGPWTATFDCKTLKAWADFFKEVRCNQWRALLWSSCGPFGICSSLECGVTYIDPFGQNRSGDCPPQDLQIERSGDDPGTITIGYTAKYNPCAGSIVVKTKAYNQPWSGWYTGGAGQCKPVSGLQTNPGTCDPVNGKSLNCAAGTSYTIAYDYSYTTQCTPFTNPTVSGPCRGLRSGSSCGQGSTIQLAWRGSGPCRGTYWIGGAWGGPVWCANTTGPDYIGCWSYSYTVVEHPEQCTQIQVGVQCPTGVVIKHSSSMCGGNDGAQRTVRCITVEYTRNDCKTPNPTAT